MAKFIADKSFWELFPDAEIGVVVLNGIDNTEAVYAANESIKDELAAANEAAIKWIPESPL
ncbi:MAG: hypothetical protein IIZ34_04460, partial [Eubacterium sp.]|nr:hypothetical protein [Eubacterium sp.]